MSRSYKDITFAVGIQNADLDAQQIQEIQDEIEQAVLDMIDSGDYPHLNAASVSVAVRDGTPITSFDEPGHDENIQFILTCSACPEQYDVMIDGEKLGYMRLRHGFFYAEYREETVYSTRTEGDGLFDDEAERDRVLSRARAAIRDAHRRYTR